MSGFKVLFGYSMKKQMKSYYNVIYNLVFPLILIGLLGYIFQGTYGGDFNSYTYYTVVTIPFCTMLGVITVAYFGKEEAICQTAVRFIVAPIEPKMIILSKVSASVLCYFCYNALLLVICYFVFPVTYNGAGIWILMLLLVQSIVISGVGIIVGLGTKNFVTVKNVINVPILIWAILGGTFYPFHSKDSLLQMLEKLSPLRWMNESVFLGIYDKDYKLIILLIIVFLFVGIGTICISVVTFRKEEFIHGDIPGYEK